MLGLVVIEGMNLSGHPWINNEIPNYADCCLKESYIFQSGGVTIRQKVWIFTFKNTSYLSEFLNPFI